MSILLRLGPHTYDISMDEEPCRGLSRALAALLKIISGYILLVCIEFSV